MFPTNAMKHNKVILYIYIYIYRQVSSVSILAQGSLAVLSCLLQLLQTLRSLLRT